MKADDHFSYLVSYAYLSIRRDWPSGHETDCNDKDSMNTNQKGKWEADIYFYRIKQILLVNGTSFVK